MSHQLINRSPDLKQLWDEGYDIDIRCNYLLVNNVPYVNARREIRYGTLVAPLTISGDKTSPPKDHVAYFKGEYPCHSDGRRITEIHHTDGSRELAPGVSVDYSFSAKPKPQGRYRDFHHKMVTYIGHLHGPAQAIDQNVTAQPKLNNELSAADDFFQYPDTQSSRAGIVAANMKFGGHRVAIVGLGGTGSYILDFLAKTRVAEIHLFDNAAFVNHNAFRAPGAPSLEQLKAFSPKVVYFAEIYSRMHPKIVPHQQNLDATNTSELECANFVFLCLDRGDHKRALVDYLRSREVPFIDSGMGVQMADDTGVLSGLVRVTAATPSFHDHLGYRLSYSGGGDDDYSQNIQIAELNALNAALAVIKWKKLCGYYDDDQHEHNSIYILRGNEILNEDLL